MAVSDRTQMATLLTGMNLTLYMANRLHVYFRYFQLIPSTKATDNFEGALIKMYTHELRFIATAIQIYQTGAATRTWQALWQTSTLADFETESDKLASRAEIEARNCDREIDARRWDNAKQWQEDLKEALHKLDEIQGIKNALAHLQVRVDLTKLTTAGGAAYNSYAEEKFAGCLAGTRTQLLHQIADWTNDPDGKCILWLCGMAGTGKSSIARTVAYDLDKRRRLGASFFFKRGEGDRGNASLFFPTIARQLADMVPDLGCSIAEALNADSFLCERNLQEQFEKLLSQPLLRAAHRLMPSGIVLVIDALDECERTEDIRTILQLLAQMENTPSLRLRIFVTSRPELPVQLGFQTMNENLHQDVKLEIVQAATIADDIVTYLEHRFAQMKEEISLRRPYDLVPNDWPGDANIQALVDLAGPLFIFAFTVCRFISESNPRRRLETVLQQPKQMPLLGLDKTYLPILNQLILERDEQEHGQLITEFRDLVGPIVLLADPLSALSLSNLLDTPLGDIGERLSNLHSVLNIPTDYNAPMRLFHSSFRDFLVDPQGRDVNRFWIDKARTHSMLAKHCLRLLSQPRSLRQDLCGFGKSGTKRADISKVQVERSITADIAYACCYWTWHLNKSGEKLRDDDYVHQFFQSHFLYWLEALSWLGRLSKAVSYVSDIRSLVEVSQGQGMNT